MPAWLVLIRAPFWLQTTDFLLCPHVEEGAGELSWAFFIRTLISVLRALPSWPNLLPKALPLSTITLGLGFKHEFGCRGRIQLFRPQHNWVSNDRVRELGVSRFCPGYCLLDWMMCCGLMPPLASPFHGNTCSPSRAKPYSNHYCHIDHQDMSVWKRGPWTMKVSRPGVKIGRWEEMGLGPPPPSLLTEWNHRYVSCPLKELSVQFEPSRGVREG